MDFLTLPTIEEESWLAQNVLKHVFVYAIWLFSLRIVGVSFSIHSTLKTQEKYITNTVGVFKKFLSSSYSLFFLFCVTFSKYNLSICPFLHDLSNLDAVQHGDQQLIIRYSIVRISLQNSIELIKTKL